MTTPRVAKRLSRVRPSGTVAITDAVNKLKAAGRSVVSFGAGEPDFDTPTVVKDAAKAALDANRTHYASAWGTAELRDAVATKHKRDNGIPCTPQDTLIAPAKQAIAYCILGLVDDGDEVIMPDPAWVSYEPLVALAGGTVVRAPATLDTDFRMTPDDVAERITPKTRMLLVNSPSNPTGGVQTREDLQGFVDLANDHDLYLVSDELYEHMVYEGDHVSPAALPGGWERTITVNGLSKSHAMTGWRMGWLVAPNPILKELVKLQMHTLTHPATFTMDAAVTALTMPRDEIDAMVAEFRVRRDLMVKGLRAIDGFTLNEPKGAFYVFPRYDFDIDSLPFAAHLLEKEGVAVTPGVEFGALGERHVRISYATSRDNIAEGLARIERAVATLPRGK